MWGREMLCLRCSYWRNSSDFCLRTWKNLPKTSEIVLFFSGNIVCYVSKFFGNDVRASKCHLICICWLLTVVLLNMYCVCLLRSIWSKVYSVSVAAAAAVDWPHVSASSRSTVRCLPAFHLMQWWQGLSCVTLYIFW